jgi:hypothetical protein
MVVRAQVVVVVVVERHKLGLELLVPRAGMVVRVTLLLLQEQTKSSVQEVVVVLDLVLME